MFGANDPATNYQDDDVWRVAQTINQAAESITGVTAATTIAVESEITYASYRLCYDENIILNNKVFKGSTVYMFSVFETRSE